MTAPAPRFPLRLKWTLAMLLVGLAPLGALAWTTLRIQREGLEGAERALQVAVIDQVGVAIDRILDDAAEATHRVGRALTEARVASEEARLELARETLARAPVLAEVSIHRPDGTLIDAIRRGAAGPPPLARVPTLEAGVEGSWAPIDFSTGTPLLRYVESVERDGERRAWVVGTLEPGILEARLRELSASAFRRDDLITLVDGELRVIASRLAALPTGASARGKDLFAQMSGGAQLRSHFALSSEFADASGAAMIGNLRALPEMGWAIAVRRPVDEAYATLARTRRTLAGAVIAVALIAILAGAFLAARTTRPVRELVALTERYGRRELDARSTVKTGDELELLGASLTKMAGDLAAGEVELARRAAVESDLSRYLPAEIARAIAEGKQSLALGGERRQVSVLFADVVAFTSFAEAAPPERVVAFLNQLFTVLTEVVFRHGGIVDKFIGDSVMAIFGAPEPRADHARRALAAAEDIHRFVDASRHQWRESWGVDVRLGIGVHSGEAVVGNLGSERRMEYTAIGDVVNTAARLETLARPGQTLLTAEVAKQAGDAFSYEALGSHPIRGKKAPVEVLELRS